MVSLTGREGSFKQFTDEEAGHGSSLDHDNSTEILLAQSNISTFVAQADVARKLPTVWVAILQIFLIVAFEIVIFLASDLFHLKWLGGVDPPFAFLSVLHVSVWVLLVICDRYFHYHHHLLRTHGYLNLFTSTKDLRRVPLMILSLGNAVLLIVVSVIGNVEHKETLSLVRIFQIVASMEVFTVVVITLIYVAKVIVFNRSKALPDAYHQDMLDGQSFDDYKPPEIGYRDSEGLDDLLEKQAEMIRYLQQHNTNLNRKVVDLTEERNEILQHYNDQQRGASRKS